jgi:hypothetical protein
MIVHYDYVARTVTVRGITYGEAEREAAILDVPGGREVLTAAGITVPTVTRERELRETRWPTPEEDRTRA